MSNEGWELYTLHEAETHSGKPCYNCIFTREVEYIEEQENIEVGDIKSPLDNNETLRSVHKNFEEKSPMTFETSFRNQKMSMCNACLFFKII